MQNLLPKYCCNCSEEVFVQVGAIDMLCASCKKATIFCMDPPSGDHVLRDHLTAAGDEVAVYEYSGVVVIGVNGAFTELSAKEAQVFGKVLLEQRRKAKKSMREFETRQRLGNKNIK